MNLIFKIEILSFLHREQRFMRVFIAFLLTRITDSIGYIGISWLILRVDGGSGLAWLSFLVIAPGLVVPIVAGIISDHMERRRLTFIVDLLRGSFLGIASILWYINILEPISLYATYFILSILQHIYSPAVRSLARDYVEDIHLITANSCLAFASQAGGLIGAMSGGLIVAYFSEFSTLLISCLGFLGSGLILKSLPKIQSAMIKNSSIKAGLIKKLCDLYAPFISIINNRSTLPMILMAAYMSSSISFLNLFFPFIVSQQLALKADVYGLVEAIFGISGMIGALIMPNLAAGRARASMAAGLPILYGVAFVFASFSSDIIWLCISAFFLGAAYQGTTIVTSLAQLGVTQQYQGRLVSIINILSALFGMLIVQLCNLAIQYGDIGYASVAFGILLMILPLGFIGILRQPRLKEVNNGSISNPN